MPHPRNRRERFLIGQRKGEKRARAVGHGFSEPPSGPWFMTTSVRLRKTTKLCSCYMCGNPRKFYKELTMQEKRIGEKYADVQ